MHPDALTCSAGIHSCSTSQLPLFCVVMVMAKGGQVAACSAGPERVAIFVKVLNKKEMNTWVLLVYLLISALSRPV